MIEDIRPIPTKQRSPLGIVELALDQGQSVKAVGVVYGLEQEISGEGFRATLFLDQYNQRIKIQKYEATRFEDMILKIRWIAEANGFDKIICMAPRQDWQKFLKYGYVLEAILKYFLNGEDAFVVSKFRSQERLTAPNLADEILLIEDVMRGECTPLASEKKRPEGYEFRMARREDVSELVQLYQSIFETYPSPLIHESYLETVFQKDSLFAVCTREGKIVSAASAELYPQHHAAELTDCATLQVARGKGLMRHLLSLLEEQLEKREYICAYTMARGRSYGMNNVFYRLGYEFTGRLVNNCDIFGAYEDMNIWVKKLRK